MRKVKLDDKSRFMYAAIFAVLIVALAFIFGYKKLEDKATALNAENDGLKTRIAALEQYYKAEKDNLRDTEEMTKGINDILSEYSSGATFEDGVYEAIKLYGASGNSMEYDKIGFADPIAVKEIPLETVTAAGIEGYDQAITFYQFDVDYTGKVLYEGLKDMVDEIVDNERYNLAIAEMNYQINRSGYIEGDTLVSFYCVDGAGLSYEEPPYEEYKIGLSNLFGVVYATEEEEAEEADK